MSMLPPVVEARRPVVLRRREEPRPRRRLHVHWIFLVIPGIIILTAAAAAIAIEGTGYAYRGLPAGAQVAPLPPSSTPIEKRLTQLRGDEKKLEATLLKKIPPGTYVVIDQTHNRNQGTGNPPRYHLERDQRADRQGLIEYVLGADHDNGDRQKLSEEIGERIADQ